MQDDVSEYRKRDRRCPNQTGNRVQPAPGYCAEHPDENGDNSDGVKVITDDCLHQVPSTFDLDGCTAVLLNILAFSNHCCKSESAHVYSHREAEAAIRNIAKKRR